VFVAFLPLVLMLLVELGSFAIMRFFEPSIRKYAAYIAFMPVISAVNGNHGLQSGTIQVRALAVDASKGILQSLKRELMAGLVTGSLVCMVLSALAWWQFRSLLVILVVSSACMSGMLTSAMMGVLMPEWMEWAGFDPAILAGPLESSFQDIIGFLVYLSLLGVLLG